MQFGKNLNSVFILVLCLFMLSLFTFTACNSDSTTGTLETSLTDASTDEFKSVWVTIKDVKVHKADEDAWESVMDEENKNSTYDLLELVNGVTKKLGTHELETGKYTQMRLIIGTEAQGDDHPHANYVVENDDNEVDSDENITKLKIPSGPQTGIKLIHPFTISNNSTTHLILDFDASRSIVTASKGGLGSYILIPTIKIIEEKTSAYVKGQVNATDGENMNGTKMSLQTYNSSDKLDPRERVNVLTHTIAKQNNDTQDNAGYQLQIREGTYNLVGYKPGYQPKVKDLEVEEGENYIRNFTLEKADTGFVNGTLNGTITTWNKEYQYINLSFQREMEDDMVEIDGQKIAIEIENSNTFDKLFNATLPHGDYSIVASTNGSETIVKDVTLDSTQNATNLEFDFTLK